MAKVVRVGKLEFRTQKLAVEFFRDIRDRYSDGEVVAEADAAHLMELIRLHSEADNKIGIGIVSFSVTTDAAYGRTRHFVLYRKDGSSTDFSFLNCIQGSSARSDALNALREEIAEQTVSFKQSVFADKQSVPCAVRGTQTSFRDAHVDHQPPRTFAALAADWLRKEHLTLEDVAVVPTVDNAITNRMADTTQAASWRQFHMKLAVLRIVCAQANLSDVRVSSGSQQRPRR